MFNVFDGKEKPDPAAHEEQNAAEKEEQPVTGSVSESEEHPATDSSAPNAGTAAENKATAGQDGKKAAQSTEDEFFNFDPDNGKKKKKSFWNKKTYTKEDYGDEPVTGFKMVMLALKSRWVPILVVSLIVFVGCCAYFYWRSLDNAEAIMSLNYEESTKGLYPNGVKFNMYDIHNDGVVNLVIDYAGLKDNVSTEDMKKAISITPIVTNDTSLFIATSYRISLSKPKGTKGISTHDLMSVVQKAYTDYFMSNYASNISFVNTKVDDISYAEYKELSAQISTKINQLKRLVEQRMTESPSYKSGITGYSYKELNQLLTNLKTKQYDIFSSYVNNKGVARDKDTMITSYAYKNKLLGVKRDKADLEYNIRTRAVDIYNRAIIESILVPTVDKEGQFYMSRTKIGIDDITKEASNYLQTSKDYQVSIDNNTEYINNVQTYYNEDNTALTDMYAQNAVDELQRVQDLIVKTDDDYIAEKTKSYVTFDQTTISPIIRVRIKRSIAFMLLAALLMLLGYYGEAKRQYKGGEIK